MAERASRSGKRNVEITSTARTFWLGGKEQTSPSKERTPVLVVQGNAKALEEARELLELQERLHGIEVAKW